MQQKVDDFSDYVITLEIQFDDFPRLRMTDDVYEAFSCHVSFLCGKGGRHDGLECDTEVQRDMTLVRWYGTTRLTESRV